MGSIRSSNIKNTAQRLVQAHPDQFGKDFHKNREIVKQIVSGTSKKTLNNISGYVTRYILKLESRRKKEEEDIIRS